MRPARVRHLCLGLLLPLLAACDQRAGDRIRLEPAAEQTAGQAPADAVVLRVSAEPRRRLVIGGFDNATGQPELAWLERGVGDIFQARLAQHPELTVSALDASLRAEAPQLPEDVLAAARSAGGDQFLSGSIELPDGKLALGLRLYDLSDGKLVRGQRLHVDTGLDGLFSLVALASQQLGADKGQPTRTQQAQLTDSLEAYRHYSRGRELRDKLFVQEAHAEFTRALEQDPEFGAAYMARAGVNAALENSRAARADLERADQLRERLPRLERLSLDMFLAELAGDRGRLLELRDELWRLAPYDVEARMRLAGILFGMQDLERAREEYELVIQLDPQRKLAYNQLGYIYGRRGDLNTALEYLEEYQRLAPDEPNPLDSQGEILMQAGRLEEAIAPLEAALRLRPSFWFSTAKLALLHAELGSRAAALSYSERWLEQLDDEAERVYARSVRGALLWRFGHLVEAEQELERAHRADPEHPRPVMLLAALYRDQGRAGQARELEQAFLERHAESFPALNWSGPAVISLLRLLLDAELPERELLALVVKLGEQEQRPAVAQLHQMFEGVLHLRVGQTGEAERCLYTATDELSRTLAQLPSESWPAVWNYVVEAVRRAPAPAAEQLVGELREVARRAGRQDLEVLVGFLEAERDASQGRVDELQRRYAQLGVPREDAWRFSGPWRPGSFHQRFAPEPGSSAAARREVDWKPLGDGDHDGFVDFERLFGPSPWSVGYAALDMVVPERQLAEIRFGVRDAGKLWLNDSLIWQAWSQSELRPDRHVVKVILRRGRNRLLLKLENNVGDWGYTLRVTDAAGLGLEKLEFEPPSGELPSQLSQLR